MAVSILIECSYRTGGSEVDGYKEGGKFISAVLVFSVSLVVLCFYVLIMIVLYLCQKPFIYARMVSGLTAICSFTPHHCADQARIEMKRE